MTKREDIKRFYVIPNVGVCDDLTGKIYHTYRDFAKLLNQIDERANKNAEDYYDLLMKQS